jgi:hypothetical protein
MAGGGQISKRYVSQERANPALQDDLNFYFAVIGYEVTK